MYKCSVCCYSTQRKDTFTRHLNSAAHTKKSLQKSHHEIQNEITGGKTPASFEPTIDYVISKIPKFTFEKFKGSDNVLSSSMKSVGEVMGIGGSFLESFQKALRSLEGNLSGIEEVKISIEDDEQRKKMIRQKLKIASPNRVLLIAQALREGISAQEINEICSYDMWFIEQLESAILVENKIKKDGLPKKYEEFLNLKKMGFSDKRLAKLAGISEKESREIRRKLNINPVYKRVDSCSAEFDSITPYMYSTYE